MSGSGFARPDLCSIHAAIEQVGPPHSAACSAPTATQWRTMTRSEARAS